MPRKTSKGWATTSSPQARTPTQASRVDGQDAGNYSAATTGNPNHFRSPYSIHWCSPTINKHIFGTILVPFFFKKYVFVSLNWFWTFPSTQLAKINSFVMPKIYKLSFIFGISRLQTFIQNTCPFSRNFWYLCPQLWFKMVQNVWPIGFSK